jgi:hypothetical protein
MRLPDRRHVIERDLNIAVLTVQIDRPLPSLRRGARHRGAHLQRDPHRVFGARREGDAADRSRVRRRLDRRPGELPDVRSSGESIPELDLVAAVDAQRDIERGQRARVRFGVPPRQRAPVEQQPRLVGRRRARRALARRCRRGVRRPAHEDRIAGDPGRRAARTIAADFDSVRSRRVDVDVEFLAVRASDSHDGARRLQDRRLEPGRSVAPHAQFAAAVQDQLIALFRRAPGGRHRERKCRWGRPGIDHRIEMTSSQPSYQSLGIPPGIAAGQRRIGTDPDGHHFERRAVPRQLQRVPVVARIDVSQFQLRVRVGAGNRDDPPCRGKAVEFRNGRRGVDEKTGDRFRRAYGIREERADQSELRCDAPLHGMNAPAGVGVEELDAVNRRRPFAPAEVGFRRIRVRRNP